MTGGVVTVVSVGYQGRSVDELIDVLRDDSPASQQHTIRVLEL